MPRNAEVIRQWKILRTLEAARQGVTISALANQSGVTTRTIRRDLEALQEAGFPLVDERGDRRTRWKLMPGGLKGLHDSGLTMSELASLYFSRALVECLVGTPFHEDARSAMDKVAAALPARMRAFLDRLPTVLNVKATARKKRDEARSRKHISHILSAVLDQRQVSMYYHSVSSRQTKEYLVEPYRIAYAHGGMYLIAQVPKYQQLRTFAVERIKSLRVTSETFDAPEGTTVDPFPNSLGVHTGPPERVEIEFLPEAAIHVKERTWHASQQVREKPDGSIRLTLSVCNDWALRSWILSFGPLARVVTPSSLAESILEQLEDARDRYAPQLDLGLPASLFDLSNHPRLPFQT